MAEAYRARSGGISGVAEPFDALSAPRMEWTARRHGKWVGQRARDGREPLGVSLADARDGRQQPDRVRMLRIIEDGLRGPALHNPGFLATATDDFLTASIVRGYPGTEMPRFGNGDALRARLLPAQVADLVAFLRSWAPPARAPVVRGTTASAR